MSLSIADQVEVDPLAQVKAFAIAHYKIIAVCILVLIGLVLIIWFVPNPVSEAMFTSKLEEDIDELIDEINNA
jgi:L-asparagine transporter-like permease